MASRTEARNRRPDARNAHAPPGMHWCSAGHYDHVSAFARNAAKRDGLHNRCRTHEREYREGLEQRVGKRHLLTKTLRVDNETHQWVKERKGSGSVAQFLRDAVSFYLVNVCVAPGCKQVGLRELDGICRRCS